MKLKLRSIPVGWALLLAVGGCDGLLGPEPIRVEVVQDGAMNCEVFQTNQGPLADCRFSATATATGSGFAEWRAARISAPNNESDDLAPSEVADRFGAPTIYAGESQSARFVYIASGGRPVSATLELSYLAEDDEVESVTVVIQ